MGTKTKFTRAPPLACRDDLHGSLAHAWEMLNTGAEDRSVPFHLPSLATVDTDGQPHARIVVLRECNAEERWLRFNTDIRSPKVSQITANPRGTMLFYDKFQKVQLRLKVRLRLLDDALLDDIWAGVQHYSRECYQITPAPGTHISGPEMVPSDAASTNEGRDHFASIRANVLAIDWLYLSSDQHRRAQFRFDGDETEAHWVVP